MFQHTIQQEFSVFGKGLHTGLHLRAVFKPAPVGSGIRICRVDLPQRPSVPALAEYVCSTERGTVLADGECCVSTVEHAMSALSAMGVDNCQIEVDGPEMPILDGSAREYVEKIAVVGLAEQNERREYLEIKEPVVMENPQTGSWLRLEPSESFSAEVEIEFHSPVLGCQKANLASMYDYSEEIASARTFCFVREIEPLLQKGYIKGGDLKNAIVIYDEPLTQEQFDMLASNLSQQIHREASELGYLTPLLFDNEPARHKLLDLIGDLALVGKPLKAHVTAYKPGHGSNTLFAKQLRERG